jgi:hypothetical protein
MAALVAHMLNMWSRCQGANDELMESNSRKAIEGGKIKKEHDKKRD